jgi:hypothetical protein
LSSFHFEGVTSDAVQHLVDVTRLKWCSTLNVNTAIILTQSLLLTIPETRSRRQRYELSDKLDPWKRISTASVP